MRNFVYILLSAFLILGSTHKVVAQAFITEWITTDGSITIPTTGGGYVYDVSYRQVLPTVGTTTTLTGQTGNCTIAGLTNGNTYEVSITGTFPRIFFPATSAANAAKIRNIKQWGNIAWTSFGNAFGNSSLGCTNLNSNATDTPNLSGVTSLIGMFQRCTSFNGTNVASWDTQSVTSMQTMFQDATAFNQPIGSWNTQNVTNMAYILSGATAFNQSLANLNVTNLNAGAGNGGEGMLAACGMNRANYDATLIGWSTQNVKTGVILGVGGLVYCAGVSARATLISSKSWVIGGDALNCTPFVTEWITTDGSITIPTAGGGYVYDVSYRQVLPTVGTTTTLIDKTGNCTITGLTNGNTYEVSIIGRFPRIFFPAASAANAAKIRNIKQWGDKTWTSFGNAFGSSGLGCTNLNSNATDTPNLSGVNSLSGMFQRCASFNGTNVASWNTQSVTNMQTMFADAIAFNQPIGSWNTQNVTNMAYMLVGATAFNQSLANWNVTNLSASAGSGGEGMLVVCGMNRANYDATLIGWATQNVKTGVNLGVGGLVYCASVSARATLISSKSWVIGGDALNCTPFITEWITTDGSITIPTTGGGYVYDVSYRQVLPTVGTTTTLIDKTGNCTITGLTNGNTYEVSIIGRFPRIFFPAASAANAAKIRNIKQWGDKTWTSFGNAFGNLGLGCTNLNSNATDTPNLSGVTSLAGMFQRCASFNGTNVASWNTQSVTNMQTMFADAIAFNQPIGSWNTQNVTNMAYMLVGATAFNQSLANWNVTNLSASAGSGGEGMLAVCGMNRANYDATLIGWSTQNVKTGVNLGVGGLFYCAGASARTTLISSKNWVIGGDTFLCAIFSKERGNMISLDGTNDYISTPSVVSTATTNLAVECWAKITSTPATSSLLFYHGDAAFDGYGVLIDNTNTLQILLGSVVVHNTNFTLTLNQWHHIGLVSSGNVWLVYVNGVLQGTPLNAVPAMPAGKLTIGSAYSAGTFSQYLQGNMDEFRFWNTARTQAQIRESMHLTSSGLESGLIVYYQFNEASGIAVDAINGNHGTLQNGALRTASEVAVAGGTFERMNVSIGLNTFTNAKVAVNFTTAPADEFVAYQLRGGSYNGLGAGTNTASCYWIVRQFGTGSVAYNGMNFTLPASNIIADVDVTTPSNLKLYKRPDNATTSFPASFASATYADNSTKVIQFTGFTSQTSFSQFEIGSIGSLLPTTLLGLKGERVEGLKGEMTEEIRLNWSTATEINNKGFEVEMSENGRDYAKIAFVEGKGNSTSIVSYQLSTFNSQDSYYRLRQVDFDGTFSYSPVVFVEGVAGKVMVYPNPSNGAFNISVGKDKLASPARLLNAQGIEVWKGTQTEVKTNLPAGMYFLHTTVAGKTKVTKVVIER